MIQEENRCNFSCLPLLNLDHKLACSIYITCMREFSSLNLSWYHHLQQRTPYLFSMIYTRWIFCGYYYMSYRNSTRNFPNSTFVLAKQHIYLYSPSEELFFPLMITFPIILAGDIDKLWPVNGDAHGADIKIVMHHCPY